MKKYSKILSLVLAMIMVLGLFTATAFAATDKKTISISNSATGFTYDAYQIFKGDLSGSTLSNITWGSGVNGDNLLAALKTNKAFNTTASDNDTNVFKACNNASDVAAVLSGKNFDDQFLQDFADVVKANLSSTKAATATAPTSGKYVLTVDPGYYFVENSVVPSNSAYTRYILNLTDDNVAVAPKSAKPTVDKQVWDEDEDDDSEPDANWGETADHAMNEVFKFKLTAKLPNDDKINDYDHYYLEFHDTYSAGITYVGNPKISINGGTETAIDMSSTSGNVYGTHDSTTRKLNFVVVDLKNELASGVNLKNATVVITYEAKLNENADVVTTPDTITSTNNENDVILEYSNNPNNTGNGSTKPDDTEKTEKDYVWVFTYKMPNTKYKDSVASGNELAGAGFKLKNAANQFATISNGKVTGWDATGTEITSAANGDFSITGLDAGTYILTETTTPEGYNTCSDITVVIKADPNHVEKADGTGATVTMTLTQNGDDVANINVINNSGLVLPETGGIGTTIFTVGGILLMAAAAILLITKKRSNIEE